MVISPNEVKAIPDDVEAMAEIIVKTFEDTDDLEILHRMICKAVMADRDKAGGIRAQRHALAARLAAMTEDERTEYKRTVRRRQCKSAPSHSPEREAARSLRRYYRIKETNPEKMRAKRVLEEQRRKERRLTDPAYREVLQARARKKYRRKWCRDNPDKLRDLMEASVPKTYGLAVRVELISMLTERFMTGEVLHDELKSELKSVVTAYWKVNPSKFGPQSLDAQRFHDGKASLHDTVSEGLWNKR